MAKRETQKIETALAFDLANTTPVRLGGPHPNCVRVIAGGEAKATREFQLCATGATRAGRPPALVIVTPSDGKLAIGDEDKMCRFGAGQKDSQAVVYYAKDAPKSKRALGRRRRRHHK